MKVSGKRSSWSYLVLSLSILTKTPTWRRRASLGIRGARAAA